MNEGLCLLGVWLVTYLMHSTLMLGGVGLCDYFRCFKSNANVELLWRVALVGGIVTATFQCTSRNFNLHPFPGWSLGHWMEGERDTPDKAVVEAGRYFLSKNASAPPRNGSEDPSTGKNRNSTVVVDLPSKITTVAPKNSSRPTELTYAYAESVALGCVTVLALLWIFGAIMNTSRLVWLGLLAHTELQHRTLVDTSQLGDFMPTLDQGLKPPKLSASPNIDGPIALPNGEIVVPDWVLDSLSVEQRQAVYAHEIAHQLRRDPLWLLFLHLLNAILWMQPLHRLARRRLIHLAELQADAWAARTVANARVLAESLVACAERVIAPSKFSFGSSFTSRGLLVERVERLIDGSALAMPHRSYLTQVAALAVLAIAMFWMPGCNVDREMAYRSGEKISVTKQGDGKKGEASIRRANLLVKMSHVGSMKLSENKDDIALLEHGGRFQLAESQGKTKRVYSILADDQGQLQRTYSLNGKATPIDEAVQVWFAEALQRTVLETKF